jgi:hypothetical protein
MLALDPALLGAVGMSSKDLSGWIGLAGPYDFLPIKNAAVRRYSSGLTHRRNRSRSTMSGRASLQRC